ncbi:transposase [Streptoverticillium reticulum]|uniref:transposase n=1 Tax=Streptoverticillium reticulum TaxID=1433415 RepID=UPI0039BEFC21
MNLLVRYINQGRVEADHAALPPRKATGLLLADPARQRVEQRVLRDQLTAVCPEMTSLAALVSEFALLLSPSPHNAKALTGWIAQARDTDLPFLHSFTTGLERDRAAVDAALTLPHHNGRTEGVNNKIEPSSARPTAVLATASYAIASCSADTPAGRDQRLRKSWKTR